MAQSALPEAHQILLIGQDHHRIVVDAIENREGARAEAVMREHARLAARNLRLALRNRTHLDLLPALALLKIRSRIGESPCALPSNGAGARVDAIRDVTPDDPRIPDCGPRTAASPPYPAGSHINVAC